MVLNIIQCTQLPHKDYIYTVDSPMSIDSHDGIANRVSSNVNECI